MLNDVGNLESSIKNEPELSEYHHVPDITALAEVEELSVGVGWAAERLHDPLQWKTLQIWHWPNPGDVGFV